MDRIARSRELFDLGRHRAAFDLLKPAAEGESAPFVHRRALAQLYRELGCPDQAGRWGIVLDGWTTDVEKDRLARLLAANGVPARSARRFLAVPPEADLPEFNAVVEDRLPGYRARFKAEGAGSAMTRAEHAGSVGFGFGVAAALGAFAGLVAVFFVALLGGDAQPIAGAAALLVGLFISLVFVAFGFEHVLKGRSGAGTIRIVGGLILLAVLAGAFAFITAS